MTNPEKDICTDIGMVNLDHGITAPTRKEIDAKIEAIEKKKLNEKKNDLTILKICQRIYKDKLEKNIVTVASYERALYTLSKIEEHYISSIPISELTVSNLDNFSQTIKFFSQSVINKIFGMLKVAFEYAMDKELINQNILRNYTKPKSLKETKKVRALTKEEHKKLNELILNSKYYSQYIIALNTGMRMGEINALHYTDINLKDKIIHVNKTVIRGAKFIPEINKKTKTEAGVRKIPITKSLHSFLSDFLKDKEKDFLFLNPKGRPIATGTITSELKRLTKNNEYSSHMLRHTFATRAIESGMPAIVLSRLLGHKDIKTTLDTYTDVFHEFQSEHVEILENYLEDI